MEIVICDDDRTIHDKIKLFIEQYSEENTLEKINIYCYEDCNKLLKSYMDNENSSIDMIFMDIELTNDINGIDVVKILQEKFNNIIIFFVTSYINYAPETFRVGAFQLLNKPINKYDFDNDFGRALKAYMEMHDNIVINWQGCTNVIELKDIIFIEANRRHLFIHTKKNIFECKGKLSDYEEKLKSKGFVLTHQSFLVNMKFIKSINIADIQMKDESLVFLSKHKRKDVLKQFAKFMIKG